MKHAQKNIYCVKWYGFYNSCVYNYAWESGLYEVTGVKCFALLRLCLLMPIELINPKITQVHKFMIYSGFIQG